MEPEWIMCYFQNAQELASAISFNLQLQYIHNTIKTFDFPTKVKSKENKKTTILFIV
jgi:hypothetical protein